VFLTSYSPWTVVTSDGQIAHFISQTESEKALSILRS
jgi:hypothetical protein